MNGHAGWQEKMLQPFDRVQIGIRPQLWCTACAKSPDKACGQVLYDVKHERKKCAVCGQKVSAAHLHLYYIGHAQLTRRLIEVDPRWRWEPMHRDIDHPEVLIAAIASGNPQIVQMILDSFPPKLTDLEIPDNKGGVRVERGMWIRLIIHDEGGNEVVMIGFGDAKGKLWGGDALKEIIGDALRNAAMRRGGGLGLWESQDLEQAQRERQGYDPHRERMALFDDDAKDPPAIGSGTPPPEPPHPEAQAALDLAWVICQRQDTTPADAIEKIRVEAHGPAAKARYLGKKVRPPWSKDPAERLTLAAAMTHVKNVLEMRADQQALAARQADETSES
jgi:hypothetical protein